MAVITKTSVRNPNGVTPTMNPASAGGDQITAPGNDLILLVRNGSGASINVTLVTPGTLPTGDAYPDKVIAVAAGTDKFIPVGVDYLDSNNQVSITWSATASVTFAALSV